MKQISIAEARKKITKLEEEFSDEDKIISITKHNKPAFAIMSWNFYETLMETLEVMKDETLMSQLKESISQIKENKTINWKKAKEELGI
jgi:prevent-host-death family protein